MAPRRPHALALAAVLVASLASGCGGDDSDETTSSADGSTTTSVAAEPDPVDGASTTPADDTATSATDATATTALTDASEAQRSAPGDGTGTALLRAVRVGQNEGFERIVFEFEGTSVPGYRIGWVDPPITADGSGLPVEVEGEAFLEMIIQPASGVDLSGTEVSVIYAGPDRVPLDAGYETIVDLVRTGDFEAVLTWVAGASERVPFRVTTLASPTRLVVDLAA